MIETKEQYSEYKVELTNLGIREDTGIDVIETIEALRDVAKAANAMNEADQMDEGVIFFNRVLPALDALPNWLTDE